MIVNIARGDEIVEPEKRPVTTPRLPAPGRAMPTAVSRIVWIG
jgi:hypothetical protein